MSEQSARATQEDLLRQRSVLYTMNLPGGGLEVILQPYTMPDSYEASVDYIARVVLASEDPDAQRSNYLPIMTACQGAEFCRAEDIKVQQAKEQGRVYQNAYRNAHSLAARIIGRGYDEQGARPIDEGAIAESSQPALLTIPEPRNGFIVESGANAA